MMNERWASISLDLDNKWSYLKTHGNEAWAGFPSYFDLVVPRILDFFEKRKLQITVFVVGQDAALDKNYDAIRSLAQAGHELGNHSFHHDPWLHLMSESELHDELLRTEQHLLELTGQQVRGFRGPGFSHSPGTLRVLAERGYHYDASTFPTFLGPLARAYYFMTARFTEQEKQERAKLFGTLADGLRPLRPYYWRLGDQRLLEMPVTTLPLLRTPIHQSYLSFLCQLSPWAARTYAALARHGCRWIPGGMSLLLHPLDFLGADDEADLAFFPGMRLTGRDKLELLGQVIDGLASGFELMPMCEHAARIKDRPAVLGREQAVHLPARSPWQGRADSDTNGGQEVTQPSVTQPSITQPSVTLSASKR